MKNIITVSSKGELKEAAAKAYAGTREGDGMYRGFSSAVFGIIECRATPCQSRSAVADWFSYRYYVSGKQVKESSI